MQLYFLRHGLAVRRENKSFTDQDRPITAIGQRNLVIQTKGLQKLVSNFDLIITSPYKRCLQTAELVRKVYKIKGQTKISQALKPCASFSKQKSILTKFKNSKKILIVGHSPDLEFFISNIVGAKDQKFELKKGGLCRVDIDLSKKENNAKVIWLLAPKVLRALGQVRAVNRKVT